MSKIRLRLWRSRLLMLICICIVPEQSWAYLNPIEGNLLWQIVLPVFAIVIGSISWGARWVLGRLKYAWTSLIGFLKIKQ